MVRHEAKNQVLVVCPLISRFLTIFPRIKNFQNFFQVFKGQCHFSSFPGRGRVFNYLGLLEATCIFFRKEIKVIRMLMINRQKNFFLRKEICKTQRQRCHENYALRDGRCIRLKLRSKILHLLVNC